MSDICIHHKMDVWATHLKILSYYFFLLKEKGKLLTIGINNRQNKSSTFEIGSFSVLKISLLHRVSERQTRKSFSNWQLLITKKIIYSGRSFASLCIIFYLSPQFVLLSKGSGFMADYLFDD